MRFLFTVICFSFCTALQADLDGLLEPLVQVKTKISEPVQVMEKTSETKKTSLPKVVVQVKEEDRVAETKKELIRIDFNDIRPLLIDQIVQRYGLSGELKIELSRNWSGSLVSGYDWDVEILRFPSQGLRSRFVANIRLFTGAQVDGEFSLPLVCELMESVYVSKRQIRRGEPLMMSDFETRTMDVLSIRSRYVPVDESLKLYESVAAIRPGEILNWRHIGVKPLVRKGQVIEAMAGEGFMSISMKALALENGTLGDFISVRNLNSQKEIQAQIVDANTVKVYF